MAGTVLITGGAGFIGSHLAERLLAEGWRVVCLDNFDPYYPRCLKERNLAALRGHPRFRFVEADVRRPRGLREALRGEDVAAVAHLAARPGVRHSFRYPGACARTNVLGTLSVASFCREMRVEKLLLASSSSVYGPVEGAVREEGPTRPISPYGASKLAAEAIAGAYASAGLACTVVRLFTVYGPRQRPDMAISRFATALARERPLTLYGDGLVQRDFTFVDDAVEGLVRALAAPLPGLQLFNIGRGEPAPVERVVALLEEGLGRRARVQRRPLPPGEPPLTWADIGKARRLLSYAPRVGLEEGVRRFLDWFRQSGHD